jgi:GDPmannose 4,6-dehydratase
MGNLDSKRDWGYAGDYVELMWLMLQQEEPEDYVIATGTTTSVRDFVSMAFQEAGISLVWEGSGIDEKAFDGATGKTLVEIDPCYFRPSEVDLLIGDPAKARKKLGWSPKVQLPELVNMMVKNDILLAEREAHLKNGGYVVHNYYD